MGLKHVSVLALNNSFGPANSWAVVAASNDLLEASSSNTDMSEGIGGASMRGLPCVCMFDLCDPSRRAVLSRLRLRRCSTRIFWYADGWRGVGATRLTSGRQNSTFLGEGESG
jgi:hypothetical protein